MHALGDELAAIPSTQMRQRLIIAFHLDTTWHAWRASIATAIRIATYGTAGSPTPATITEPGTTAWRAPVSAEAFAAPAPRADGLAVAAQDQLAASARTLTTAVHAITATLTEQPARPRRRITRDLRSWQRQWDSAVNTAVLGVVGETCIAARTKNWSAQNIATATGVPHGKVYRRMAEAARPVPGLTTAPPAEVTAWVDHLVAATQDTPGDPGRSPFTIEFSSAPSQSTVDIQPLRLSGIARGPIAEPATHSAPTTPAAAAHDVPPAPPPDPATPATADDPAAGMRHLWAETGPAVLDDDRYQKILGDELQKLRRTRGWTRKHLRQQLTSDISLQTLSTYEHGTRRMSVLRLVELSLALGERPQDLIARVHRRATHDALTVDLAEPALTAHLSTLAALTEPHMAPLRSWATQLLRQPDPPTHIRLTLNAVARMAQLCGITPADLLTVLGEHTR